MIDPKKFADQQFELAGEFAQYVADHPEVDDLLPEKSHICFQVEGDVEFNAYSRELAERQQQKERVPIVIVRVQGLSPRPGSRLINPIIEPVSAVA
jgi:hypothetical protein